MSTKHIISSVLTGLLLVGSVLGHAQESPSLRKRAEQMFDRYEYANAIPLFARLVDGKKPRTSDLERLAECYYLLNGYEPAENWYARATQTKDFKEESLWNYAEVLRKNGKYREAKEQYQRYADLYGYTERVDIAIAGSDSAEHWMAAPTGHKIRNEYAVNTELAQFGAFPTSNGVLYAGEPNTVYGQRSGMTGQAYLKIYSAEVTDDNGTLGLPNIMVDNFNAAEYHVGPVAANANEDVLYVTRTHPGTDLEKKQSGGKIFKRHNIEIKIYTKSGSGWSESDFPYNDVKAYSVGHASLSGDGQTLYYASDMPGGLGGVDIWYSELQSDGTWGAPQNAGPMINSSGDEMFPSVVGDFLYYSSDGFPGMGGLDIFRAKGERSSFSERENLRFPLNSPADDFSFVVADADEHDFSRGYLSSNRAGGLGSDDIYAFSYGTPQEETARGGERGAGGERGTGSETGSGSRSGIELEGLTLDKRTDAVISEASVTLYNADQQLVARVRSGADGRFLFGDLTRNAPYHVLAEAQGFHADSTFIMPVASVGDTVLRATLRLEPVFAIGHKFVLGNIYYNFDKHDIRPDAAAELDQLVRTMRDNPTLRIELSSHTDSRGASWYNDQLSQRRAQAAVDYIVSQGIARDRLVAKGYGESRLVNHCADGVPCTPEEHQANRRTEVEVIDF